jgi:hypothetical protein
MSDHTTDIPDGRTYHEIINDKLSEKFAYELQWWENIDTHERYGHSGNAWVDLHEDMKSLRRRLRKETGIVQADRNNITIDRILPAFDKHMARLQGKQLLE